jgi:hypothetical protein
MFLITVIGCGGGQDGTETSVQEHETAQAPVALPDTIPGRELAVTLEDGIFMSGGLPLIADMFTENGERTSAGGFVLGDLRDAVLDLSALEEHQWVGIASQHGGDHLASVCPNATKIVVTPDGLVYLLGATTMDSRGPFVRLMLVSEEGKQIDPKSVTVIARQGAETRAHSISGDLVTIGGISMEPIRCSFSAGTDTSKVVVFPYVRGASPELVGYRIHDVSVGKPLPDAE